jgi:hypothetical protein
MSKSFSLSFPAPSYFRKEKDEQHFDSLMFKIMFGKQKLASFLLNVPGFVATVIFIVGLGVVFGLLGYYIFGFNKNITPIVREPSTDVVRNNHFGNEFIQVKSPQKNTTIKNPVLIFGKANVFEANVRVRIIDDSKNILADDFITAEGWLDKLYPFEKEISYSRPTSQSGVVEIFEESAKDGSDLHKITIPVVFEDYIDTSDWKTYRNDRNEEYGYEVKYPGEWLIIETDQIRETKKRA